MFFVLAAAVSMRGWFVHDRIPAQDFAGYTAAVQYVRDMLLEFGRVPAWSPYFGGSTWIMSPIKEYLTFPLALWLEPLLAVKVMFVSTRVVAALGMYAIFVRGFGSHSAGLPRVKRRDSDSGRRTRSRAPSLSAEYPGGFSLRRISM